MGHARDKRSAFNASRLPLPRDHHDRPLSRVHRLRPGHRPCDRLAWFTRHGPRGRTGASHHPAPEFTGITQWLNSKPLSKGDLKGKVTLVEFWTNECINCLHVLPHTRALYDAYKADGLVVVGVHTPEYDEERDPATVKAAIRRFGIDWPVAIDNDRATWNAWGNQFWPALYLVDRQGHVVYRHFGEGHYAETEARVRELLGKR